MEPRGLEESTFPFRPWRRLPFARSHGPLKSLQTIDLMLVILAIITCFFSWFPLVFHGVTIAKLGTGFNLEATDEANKFVERLVHVHSVLGGTLDERGLQLLRHVFAVRCRHLKAISSELYSMQRTFGLSTDIDWYIFDISRRPKTHVSNLERLCLDEAYK